MDNTTTHQNGWLVTLTNGKRTAGFSFGAMNLHEAKERARCLFRQTFPQPDEIEVVSAEIIGVF